MKQLGRTRQVLAVTHLAQVAACADQHFVVARRLRGGQTLSATCSRWTARRAWPRWRACWAANACRAPAHAQALLRRCRRERRPMSDWMPMAERRQRRGHPRHRHLGLGQVGGAARAGGRRLLLRRQPAARAAARLHPPGAASASRSAWRWRWTCAPRRSLPALLPLIDELRSEGVRDAAAVPGRQHRRAGAPLLRDAPPAPAVAPAPERRRRRARAGRGHRARARAAGRPARGLHRHRHQPAAPGAAAQLGALAGRRARQPR